VRRVHATPTTFVVSRRAWAGAIRAVALGRLSVRNTLAEIGHAKLHAGTLPSEQLLKVWFSVGTGNPCTACEQPILPLQTECEPQYYDERPPIRLHVACHGVWEAERRRRRDKGRLVANGDLYGPLLEILDVGIQITGADMGNIQVHAPGTGALEIVVHQGFEAEFLDFFATVQDHTTACGTAMATGQRIIVDDVADNLIFAGSEARDVMLRAGARAVQSTPLWSRTGDLVGMLSTHYRRAGRPAERDLHRLDVLSRLAADYIDFARTE